VNPDLVLELANLTAPRKPDRSAPVYPDPLATTNDAAAALGLAQVAPAELVGLRELHHVVVELVARLLDGRGVQRQAARITALAQPSQAQARLEVTAAGELHQRLEWTDASPVAGLARQVVLEMGAIDRARLRRCGRPECDLVFYDATRSNTQRWHAESPCGQRERQRRHRAGQRAPQGPPQPP
jgi:predicted RNA-binding Zn ribbon-like protein